MNLYLLPDQLEAIDYLMAAVEPWPGQSTERVYRLLKWAQVKRTRAC